MNEYTFTKTMLDCDFADDGVGLYALVGLVRPDFDNEPNAEGVEVEVEVTIDADLDYNDGRGWATDGCCEGYTCSGTKTKIECVFEGKRFDLETILTKKEIDGLVEDAEDAAVKAAEKGEFDSYED